MSHSALTAGLRQLRHKLASQQLNEDSDESLLHAFAVRREDSAFAVMVRAGETKDLGELKVKPVE